jgi:ankyrin repeat protein
MSDKTAIKSDIRESDEEKKEKKKEKTWNEAKRIKNPQFVSLDNIVDIQKYLEKDKDIDIFNVIDDKDNTILHTNVAKDNLDIIKYLLDKKPPKGYINGQNNDGDTPLHLAGYFGNLRAVKLLLKNGADTDITNKEKLTPLESLYELKKEGKSSQDIEEVIKFLEADKNRQTGLKDYYDTLPENEAADVDDSKYDDSNIDNDDDLENTPDNIEWKENKKKIKELYNTKGISQQLVNYSNNLILFYEKKNFSC